MTFEPTPTNSTVDGWRWPNDPDAYTAWHQMEWARKEWRDGSIWSNDDPHWNVPHKSGETWHRVRQKRSRRAARRAEKEGR